MNIPNKKEYTLPFFGRDLVFTVSDLAGQANAAVMGKYGETHVLVTAVMGKEDRPSDFFPLSVDYEERFYAAGKIIGSRFVRREGRPSDLAVLSGRLIDRSVRPLFDDRLRREVQIVVTVLSYDEENDPDFVALLTTSLALAISDIPWRGPIAGMRMLFDGKEHVINPTNTQASAVAGVAGTFDAFFAGTENKINMIELGGFDASAQSVQNAFATARTEIKNLVAFEKKIIAEIGKPKTDVAMMTFDAAQIADVRAHIWDALNKELFVENKQDRDAKSKEIKDELYAWAAEKMYEPKMLEHVWEAVVNEIVHQHALEKEERVDGRALDQIRPLFAAVGLFPRLHGSALFVRGQTQALAVTTLAAPGSEQMVETMEGSSKRRFMLHYNFPPYSTGEVKRLGTPGRREIGHGALAEKALRAVIPSQEEFPYTIRVVSEVLSSNGSSSMATTCAGTLSLMDAGVPIKKPVAGIAMGLMTWQGIDGASTRTDYKVLTDIQGPEDHYGDMDLKVAGTRDGINAVQMDVKIEGIDDEIFARALEQAQKARFEILDVIQKELPAPRAKLSPFAPLIMSLSIKPYQIGGVIGSGGKVINGIVEKFGLISIDIDDNGQVFVTGTDQEHVAAAVDYIRNITHEYEVGEIIEGPVIKLLEVGAIIDLGGGKDGMVHVSEIKNGFVKSPSDVLKVGDKVRAKVIRVEENGRIGLSIKALSGGDTHEGARGMERRSQG
jgi:polyribonucleotide nucleotidyltransferase